jgi:DMSO/TMAO reductase YedYZ molybdopterin-dependent catalytic subunit/mono/diheme cytochrome c family protein
VDRPLTFTMEDLKRLPSVTRLHFIECAGNRSSPRAKNVQETHGMVSCAEWTGVLLSTLLKECGLKGSAKWFVAEGAEEVKGASSMPIAKAMDDCIIAYGMNGEPVRPQNGFPLRLMVPGFEGIFHTKWLQRIKIVDRYYLNYNDFGHLDQDAKVAALDYQIGPKSVITFPSGDQRLPGKGFYEISGLAWSGGGAIKLVEVSTDGGKKWNKAEFKGTPQRMAFTRFGYQWNWDGNATEILSRCTDELGQAQPTRTQIAKYWNQPYDQTFRVPVPVLPVLLIGGGASALAQGPTFGIGRTPTAEEIKAIDISIGPTGEELPPGKGNAKEGAQLYRSKGCAACHGAQGIEGPAPILKSKDPKNPDLWARGRILPLRAPFATTVWDYINRGMPLNREGTLTPDEVYSLTAYLLFINDVIPEDQALDQQSLPKVKMPIGDNYAKLPDWKPRTKRLPGYPH